MIDTNTKGKTKYMLYNNYWTILVFSLLGSFITVFAYAATSSGKFQFTNLTLPAVSPISIMSAIILGMLLSPLMYWTIKDKNLLIVLPIIYLLAFVITVLLCYIDQRIGFVGSFVYWVVVLIIMKYIGPVYTN